MGSYVRDELEQQEEQRISDEVSSDLESSDDDEGGNDVPVDRDVSFGDGVIQAFPVSSGLGGKPDRTAC